MPQGTFPSFIDIRTLPKNQNLIAVLKTEISNTGPSVSNASFHRKFAILSNRKYINCRILVKTINIYLSHFPIHV